MKYFLILTFYFISTVFAQTTFVNNTTAVPTTAIVNTPTLISSSSSTVPSSTLPSTTTTNTYNAASPVQSTGFNPNANGETPQQESWLKQHNRFVFIIFVGLIVLGLLIWYVVRSVKGMRKRLEEENAAQLYMMQQATNSPPPPFPYQQNRNDRVIPETIQTPPPAYKTRENTPITNE